MSSWPQIRDTSLLLIPASTPSAATRSSTLRVLTPSTHTSMTTACLAAPARRTATSSMLSPPVSIDPTTVSAFVPLFAPCWARCSRWSTSSASPIRSASTAAGNSPAFGTRFVSSKLTETRLNS